MHDLTNELLKKFENITILKCYILSSIKGSAKNGDSKV